MARLAPELRDALARRAEPDGFLPFDRFMEVALYDERVGYYARAASPFGPSGDFYTAPRVHPIFAGTLAARLAVIDAALGHPRPFSIVDLGSGDGTLLAGVARALSDRVPVEGLRFVVIDRTEARRRASIERVGSELPGAGSTVVGAGALAELGPLTGVVLGHELLDAQPARRWRWDGRLWRVLGARLDGDELHPAEGAGMTPGELPDFPTPKADEVGLELEDSPSAEGLVREIADHLANGAALLVDFGAEEGELRAAHPRGTVASVRGHRALASPWEEPGSSDLAVFVNFTRVRAAARRAGLTELAYRGQAEALGAWGFPRELEAALSRCSTAEETVRLRLAAKNLLFGFGTFRVLELAPRASASALATLSAVS